MSFNLVPISWRAPVATARTRGHLNPFRKISQKPQIARPSLRQGLASHTLAGVLGGLVVIAAGYTWYHFSGLKRVADTANQLKINLEEARRSLAQKSNPNLALLYLRKVAKLYVSELPGASVVVDQAFDSVEGIVQAHTEEATVIVTRAYQEIAETLKQNPHQRDMGTAMKVMGVLKQCLSELQTLGKTVGGNTLGPLWEKFSASNKIGRKIEELRRLGRDT